MRQSLYNAPATPDSTPTRRLPRAGVRAAVAAPEPALDRPPGLGREAVGPAELHRGVQHVLAEAEHAGEGPQGAAGGRRRWFVLFLVGTPVWGPK